jgi:hypothetical protein
MQLLSPLQLTRMVAYTPQFVRVFWRLMTDDRVSILAKLVPALAVALMLTPPALELDLVPIVGELDWVLVGYLALKVFVWLCPPEVVREHVSRIAQGS